MNVTVYTLHTVQSLIYKAQGEGEGCYSRESSSMFVFGVQIVVEQVQSD